MNSMDSVGFEHLDKEKTRYLEFLANDGKESKFGFDFLSLVVYNKEVDSRLGQRHRKSKMHIR